MHTQPKNLLARSRRSPKEVYVLADQTSALYRRGRASIGDDNHGENMWTIAIAKTVG